MPIDLEKLRNRVVVERVTVSAALSSGRKGDGDFVSLTVRAVDGEFTLVEAHIIHKMVSREATEMAYMDALAKGHKSKEQVAADLPRRLRNYDTLIDRLARKANKSEERTKKTA